MTRQFYDWEVRGRGWQVYDSPVLLEPPFRPFLGHFLPAAIGPSADDGRRRTRLNSLFHRSEPRHDPPVPYAEDEDPAPKFQKADFPLAEIQIALPAELKITKGAASQFLLSLGRVSRPVSLEFIGTKESVVVQLACAVPDRVHVEAQLAAYFPEGIRTEAKGYLSDLWKDASPKETAVVDFGLSKEFMRPLQTYDRFDPDPIAGIVAGMSDLHADEVAVLQVLLVPAQQSWAESILRAVRDSEGGSFFADDPMLVKLATEKVSAPLFATVIRVATQSPTTQRAWQIAERLANPLRQFTNSPSNELMPLSNEGYADDQHAGDVVARQSCRLGMLLNCDELLSIAHLPSASVRSAKLKREERRTKAAPLVASGHQIVLGHNSHGGQVLPVTIHTEGRLRHMHLVGASGSGKSTLLLNMIVQDIHNGEGLAVLDPHGDLIEQVLDRIPADRMADVVLLDPSDEEYPVGFNILSAHSDLERNLLASDLVSVFRRLSTTFGDQMVTVLGNAIMAFLESSDGGTLSDLRRFLVEAGYRERFLETVRDPAIVYYWQKEFPLLAGKPQGPILTRLDTFLRPKIIRYMVSQKTDRLDFAGIMNGRKIFLAKLSQGLIGEENSHLLGTLIVSKLNQTAMSRQNVEASKRSPFYLYVDEFHNFVTPSMAAILSGARKYGLSLILAHQELHQLATRDADVANAVIANPYTRVCFRLGDYDAKKLEDGFSFFQAKDLQNLSVGEAVCRMERSDWDFNLKTVPLLPVEAEGSARRQEIVALSREKYARRREEVEQTLRLAHESAAAETTASRRPAKIRLSVPLPEPNDTADSSRVVNTPGRGGEHHKYLQQLIKRWAEGRGYAVTLEKPVLDGLGIVDVVLEKRGSPPIACEISITTPADHEIRNAEKCLVAGFEHVFLIAPDKEGLSRVRSGAASILTPSQLKKLRFVLPEQVFASVSLLETGVPPASSPSTEASKELLTAKEVEELLRIDVKTIYGYVQKGLIPYVRIQSNLRFLRSEVLAWLAEHSSTSKVGRRK